MKRTSIIVATIASVISTPTLAQSFGAGFSQGLQSGSSAASQWIGAYQMGKQRRAEEEIQRQFEQSKYTDYVVGENDRGLAESLIRSGALRQEELRRQAQK